MPYLFGGRGRVMVYDFFYRVVGEYRAIGNPPDQAFIVAAQSGNRSGELRRVDFSERYFFLQVVFPDDFA